MAELGQLSYSIILDDKKFTKQAQGIVKKLKDVDTQINELMSSDSTRLSKPFDLAGMSIEKMVTQAKVLEVAFKGLSQSGTGVLSQDAINLKLRWQEIQAEVAKYGLNLKSSLMEQQKIVEPLKNLQQVLAMPTNSLDEIAAKLSEVKRIRAEQIQTDASYTSNMSVLNKVEGELIAQQKSAIIIGKEALTVEQQLTAELQKRPISINDIIASAKNLETLYKSLDDKESALGIEAQQRWLAMRDQLQSYGYVIKSSVMEQQTLNGALAMQENTVGQIELKMRALSAVRKNINVTEKESIETLKKVNDEYMRLGDQLKKVGARQYNLADLARNTNGAFSPLGFSIQQVARELPSLTMGAQMFFLAISNNLPILSDELRKAKESYKALIAEGKAATPVWKQVLSSIFSWQTAMVVGITLLTMYGREIGNWVKGLFTGASTLKTTTELQKDINEEIKNGSTGIGDKIVKLKTLSEAWKSLGGNLNAQKKFIIDNKTEFDNLGVSITNIYDAQNLLITNKDVFISYLKQMAKATAASKLAADQYAKSIEKENEIRLMGVDPNNIKEVDKLKAGSISRDYVKIKVLNDERKEIEKNADALFKLGKAYESEAQKSLDAVGIKKSNKDKQPQQKTPKDTTAQQDKFAQEQIRAAEDLQTKIRQAEIDADEDGFEKRMKQMKLNHEIELREIERHREDLLREVVDNQRKLFEADPKNKGKKFDTSGITLSSDQENMFSTLYSQTRMVQNSELKKELKELVRFAQEERLAYASELDKQIFSIKEHYAERRQLASGNSNILRQIEKNEINDIKSARLQYEQRQLESDAEYNQKYKELLTDRYFFESDKRRASLEQQIKDQKKIFNNLEKQVMNDPNNDEFARQLREAFLRLKILNKELEKTPEQKLSEIAGIFKEITGGLSDITGIDLSMLSNTVSGIASFATGDFIGAASSGMSVLSGFITGITSQKERQAEIQREINKLQQQYNIDLRQQNYDLISSIDYARAFRDNLEALRWLIEKGFISDVNYSAWNALVNQSDEARRNFEIASKDYNAILSETNKSLESLYKDFVSGSAGDAIGNQAKPIISILKDWKNGIINNEEAFKRLAATGWKGMSEIAEKISRSKEETQKWTDQIVELSQQMDEFATGTSFDGFLSDAMTAIDNMRNGISDLSSFTEESLTNAILSSFKYQVLAEALKPFYDTLANKFINDFDNLDKNWGDKWQMDLEQKLKELGIKFDTVFGNLGINDKSSNRTGVSGSLARASQESIDELTGVMYAGLEKLSLTSNGINAINITTTAMSAELKAQTALLRSIDNYSSRIPYIETGINTINQRGVKISSL